MIKSVFILLPSRNNDCIFYGQIGEDENNEDIGSILGTIVDFAEKLDDNQIKSIQISQGKFVYGLFGKIYLIFKIQLTDDFGKTKEILKNTATGFLTQYKKEIDAYSGDASAFEGFSERINEFLKPLASNEENNAPLEKPDEQAEENNAQKDHSSRLPAKEDNVKLPKNDEIAPKDDDGMDLIISPVARDSYPNGIDDYLRDEVLWNESQSVMKEYTAEFVDGIIARIEIFLSISVVHHFEIVIDFQNYPARPAIDSSIDLEEQSYFLKNWDDKIPPHIIELVREFEKILLLMKNKGKLDATSAMPENVLPELEPLEELPPLPEKEKKNKIKEDGTDNKEPSTN